MRLPALTAVSLAALLVAGRARAFCQSSACPQNPAGDTAGHICVPAQPDDCGIALQWRQPCISFDVQQGASNQVDWAIADAVLTRALATWTTVDCQGTAPTIQVFDFGAVECDKVEYNQMAGNANVLIFRDSVWPHQSDNGGGTADTIALTTVTYDVDKGDIYDADIEVNSANNTLTTTDTPGPDDVDLQAVLTHEAGHFLGLAHTAAQPATMVPDYTKGTIDIRTLQPDDEAAICLAYPADRAAVGACSGIPRHGYASVCGAEQTWVSCAMAPAGARGPAAPWGAAAIACAAVAALAGRRVRARRGSRGW
jgi:hypothetical protein